ncbi:MAG: [Phascolarctobacterium sp.]|nr:[FeFe] hydrogenase H-cluster radical SAM maturase HydE [Phascolarctobacterium sp.]
KNDCLYCGIRRSNRKASRYRLTPPEILECCATGYALGLRTFVLQGGEDFAYDDKRLAEVVAEIKRQYPDCAVTLSAGERKPEIYRQWFEAGADRYLLRHETANSEHYAKLHPAELNLAARLECLQSLKEIGYQVGTGFMVGSPYQTVENLVEDLLFIKDFNPHMVGIGPFIPHKDTPFGEEDAGSGQLTLKLISILRLLLPKANLPATTALNTLLPNGHQQGILAGANVIMPNLSPQNVRDKYTLYDNKKHSGSEAAEGVAFLRKLLAEIGYEIPISRGDYPEVSK